MSQGTFACSYCGLPEPHYHDPEKVNEERVVRSKFEDSYEKYVHTTREPTLRVNAWGVRASDPFNIEVRGYAWNHRNPLGHPFDYWEPQIEELWMFFKIAYKALK